MLREVGEGVAYVLRQPVFRAMALRSSTYNFCNVATSTMFLLLLASDLRLSATAIGVIFTGAGIGAAVAALAAPRLTERFARGQTSGNGVGGGRRFGLGLSLVREVSAAHGGTFTLVAMPHRGVRATIELPQDRTVHRE